MKDNDDITLQKILILLVITVLTVFLLPACNSVLKNEKEVDTNLNTINVLWQDASRWDGNTAKKVSLINPEKFIINIDGPNSHHTPTTGPHPTELVGFIDTLVNLYGYTGILVMHPDCNRSEFNTDWGGNNDTINGWKLYVDYFTLLNDTLLANKLPTFTELLIETEGSIMGEKADKQDSIFNNIKTYLNQNHIKLSATNNWHSNWTNWKSVDCYYAQLYDVCYKYDKHEGSFGIPSLCGPNTYSPSRCDTLVKELNKAIVLDSLKDVYFIFTYAPEPKPTKKNPNPKPHADAPMFGEDTIYWCRTDYDTLITKFRNVDPRLRNANTGIWHCESPLSKW
jgi:hypothetical protein